MVIVIQLILALIVGILASGFYTGYGTPGATGGFGLDGAALLAFCAATVVSVLLARCIRTGAPRTRPAGSTSGGGSGSEPGSGRETGQVKWFNYSKGFGFITRASGDDVFIHYRGIRGSGRRGLREGQRVEFDVCEGDKGLQADDVVVLDDDSTP